MPKKIINIFILLCFLSCKNIHEKKKNTTNYAHLIDSFNKEFHSDTNICTYSKRECDKINADSSYEILHFDNNNDETTEGGDIYIYMKNNTIIKTIDIYYGETGKTIFEYYFKNNELFFVYKLTEFYSQIKDSLGNDLPKKLEDRMYIKNNGIVKWNSNDPYANTGDPNIEMKELSSRAHNFDSLSSIK